jgi:hypothetical protein
VLGFTGQGMRIGILDDGVDWRHSSNWGRCTGLATPNGTCRVVASYNPFSATGDTVRGAYTCGTAWRSKAGPLGASDIAAAV